MTSQREAGDQYTARGKNLALLLLAMTQFVIVIDASIVNVALPSIGAHLHFARDDLSSVVIACRSLSAGSCSWAAGWRTCSDAADVMVGLVLSRSPRLPRARPVRGVADRRPRSPGPGGGHRLAGRALDHHDDLCRGP